MASHVCGMLFFCHIEYSFAMHLRWLMHSCLFRLHYSALPFAVFIIIGLTRPKYHQEMMWGWIQTSFPCNSPTPLSPTHNNHPAEPQDDVNKKQKTSSADTQPTDSLVQVDSHVDTEFQIPNIPLHLPSSSVTAWVLI